VQVELFSFVYTGTERQDRFLTRGNLGGAGRRLQPVGQTPLSGGSAGRAEQFEQRSIAKQVEIAGIRVVYLAKSASGAALAGPPIFHSPNSLLIKLDSALKSFALSGDSIVADYDRNEGGNEGQHQPGGQQVRHECDGGNQCAKSEDAQPKI